MTVFQVMYLMIKQTLLMGITCQDFLAVLSKIDVMKKCTKLKEDTKADVA